MGITSDNFPDSFIQWDSNEEIDTSNAVDMLIELQKANSGFVNEIPERVIQNQEVVLFVRYPFGTPKINVVDEETNIVQENIEGSEFNGTGTYIFKITISEEWETNKQYIFKLLSDDSDVVYVHSFRITTVDDMSAIKSLLDSIERKISDKLDNYEEKDKERDMQIIEAANGIRIKAVH